MLYLEVYSQACQASKMERFAKIVNGKKPLDVWQGSEYTLYQ